MRFPTATSPAPPTATPGGRAVAKAPPAYTVFPTVAWLHTAPFTCHVGRASALTVAGVPTGGSVSACASLTGPKPSPTSATSAAVAVSRPSRGSRDDRQSTAFIEDSIV